MASWNVDFFPPSGERNSPVDELSKITNKKDIAHIKSRLETIKRLEISEWLCIKWLTRERDLWKITKGNYRIYYGIHERTIVVSHINRKYSQKTKESDYQTAISNYKEYLEMKK